MESSLESNTDPAVTVVGKGGGVAPPLCFERSSTWIYMIFIMICQRKLIGRDPLSDRSSSRLMVLDKETGEIEHKIFRDIVDYLKPGDCLVINDTKVIPARLIGTKADTGATIEVLLLKKDLKTDRIHGKFLLSRERRLRLVLR